MKNNFIGVIENTGQEIYGIIVKNYIKGSKREFIRIFESTGNVRDFGITSKLRMVTGEVVEVYKAGNSNRLIEV